MLFFAVPKLGLLSKIETSKGRYQKKKPYICSFNNSHNEA